ncbi:hypothetical protein [Micromonospora sp. CPCC 206061]|uniref:hypothetical protein n=1 Tax=Micromonospora sp. CPCC 206061 TaxID=3122410 RepID=UPI002FF1EBC1
MMAALDAFDAWLAYLFDRPAEKRRRAEPASTEWMTRHAPHDGPVAAAERIRRLFGDAGNLLRPYSDEQVGLGLGYIVDSSYDGEIRALADPRVPRVVRIGGLRSIRSLFAEVFAQRLEGDDLGGRCRTTLEHVCFMFWDIAPVGRLGDDTILDVLEDTLALDSTACHWAALHGLGHAYHDAPGHVPGIVDSWLRSHREISPALREYATLARMGAVN